MFSRLRLRRRPAPAPGPAPLTRLQAIDLEIQDLERSCAATPAGPLAEALRLALAEARMAHQYHSVPRILPAPRQEVRA